MGQAIVQQDSTPKYYQPLFPGETKKVPLGRDWRGVQENWRSLKKNHQRRKLPPAMEPTPLPDHYNCSLRLQFPAILLPLSRQQASHHWSRPNTSLLPIGRFAAGNGFPLVGSSPCANPAWFRRRKQYLVVFNLHAQGKHDIMEWIIEWCDSEPKIKPIIQGFGFHGVHIPFHSFATKPTNNTSLV